MTTYVALLRGINVGGRRKVLMADLRELLSSLELDNVRTYLQSGNAVFTASEPLEEVHTCVDKAISERFFNDIPIFLRSGEDIDALIKNNPFASACDSLPKSVHVIFLSSSPEAEKVKELDIYATREEKIVAHGEHLFVHFPNGYGKSKLTPTVVERILGVSTTARNWQTIMALQSLMEDDA
ncbi:unnamed protein product [Clonostachys byssicola]|uniref:DUF1697 domain-containing protein n=1 Tax=Clonostachys byssicola TaxID=160290 RepID=A0A9N9UED1_9HYPO|nr:unnamed protein product [Clonostachys byssicola]